MTFTPPISTTFRDTAKQLSPTYLLGPWGEKWIYAHAIILDAIADAAAFSVLAGLPSFAPSDALPWLQLDRQIDQGRSESEASFRIRLTQWLDLWLVAGSQRSVLRALTSYLTPGSYTITTVNDSVVATALGPATVTAWDSSPGGADPPTHTLANPFNWIWDQLLIPGRSWVIIQAGPWAQTPLVGGFSLGDGTVIGFNGTLNDAASIRGLVRKWKSAGDYVAEIIIAFDPAWYVPTLPNGSALLPDGSWGPWGQPATVTELTGPWGATTTQTENVGAWGVTATQQVPGPQGLVQFAPVYVPRHTRTTHVATAVPALTPIVSRTTHTATGAPGYTPTRPATSCFLGPVL